ncbi:adenylyltransferase/cytidyltransferase family protein [Clostridium saudiense]|uniref:adenylyltransferase/cytidyltransferase family protein n=1 Tax=Clostridium saudiense TaxID=1414720 RepID=UPI0026707401|nr:adenylyltransferase/cytidyltransferase family protein [Clostridium saudiense]
MKRYKRGYTQGVYDMFHIGHLNLINNAKKQCEYLIVGVNADELVQEYKNKVPVISEQKRRMIVENIKAVDEAIIAKTLDKEKQFKDVKFDVIFIGDDWKGDKRWEDTRKQLKKYGVDVVFLPHTDGVSSTDLRIVKDERIQEEKKECL